MPSKMTAARIALAAAAVILVAQMAPEKSRAVTATPECVGTAFRAKTETAVYNVNVGSGDYANVPATGIQFTQRVAGCVLVMFTSAAETAGNQIKVRAVIDGGAYVADPSDIDFTAFQDNYMASRAFNFVFKRIPAGDHTAVIQVRPAFGSGSAKLGVRSTVIFYRR